MLKCDVCLTEGHFRVRCVESLWLCHRCLGKRYNLEPSVNLRVKETKFFPSLGNVSKARVAELDRRVPIPDSTHPAGYRVGRLMENGKISDKDPSNLIRD